MPVCLEHIDAIARQVGRAVLYLEFHPLNRENYRHEADRCRLEVLDWLTSYGIRWRRCGAFADPQRMPPYLGQVYLDVPFDENLPTYREVRDYLELPNGNMRRPGVRFYVLSLEAAMKNAAHDEPGYWEQWANQF